MPRKPPARPSPARKPRQNKGDAWQNQVTGLGTPLDVQTAMRPACVIPLDDLALHDLFYGSNIAKKIVRLVPQEMFRAGYALKSETLKDDDTRLDALEGQARALRVDEHVQDAMVWGRLWGGAVIFLGQGGNPLLPAKPNAPIKFMQVLDRRYVRVEKRYDDPLAPQCGAPELYRLQPPGTSGAVVHESRCIRFGGEKTDIRTSIEQLMGWDYSVLQGPYEALAATGLSFASIATMLGEATQAVLKIEGLSEKLAQPKSRQLLMDRLRTTARERSSKRLLLVDAKMEDYLRVATEFGGVKDTAGVVQQWLSAETDIPATLLWGRSPEGMNATGASDTRGFYDRVSAAQCDYLEPILLRIYRSLGAPEDLEICYAPLWQEEPLQIATTNKMIADTDAVYVTMGAVLPQQIALARFSGGEFHRDAVPDIDENFLNTTLNQEIELQSDPEARAAAQAALAHPGPDDPADTTPDVPGA